MKTRWIVVVAVVIVLCLAGCSGTGGVGGQGITITADNTSHIEHVSITITDGGTGLGNPSGDRCNQWCNGCRPISQASPIAEVGNLVCCVRDAKVAGSNPVPSSEKARL